MQSSSVSGGVPVDAFRIRATPPNLSGVALIPQPIMTTPIDRSVLFSFPQYPEKYHHEQLGDMIEIDKLKRTSYQPHDGISRGYQAIGSSGIEYYIKITTPAHAFAQIGSKKLYDLFWSHKTGVSPTPDNFLGVGKSEDGRLRCCAIVSKVNQNLVKLSDIAAEYQSAAHKMLESLELIHRVIGNDDVKQSNVMLEVDEHGKPIRPQVVDLGEAVTHLEEALYTKPYERSPDPTYFNQYSMKDRQHTYDELSFLKPFILFNDQLSRHGRIEKKDINQEILSISMKWYCGSEHTRVNIARLLQARLNYLYTEKSKTAISDNDPRLVAQRRNPMRYE